MRRNRQTVLFLLLLTVTVIYVVALYHSMNAYEDWKRAKLEGYPAQIRPYVDFDPYFSSGQGAPMFMLGVALGLGWFIAVVFLREQMQKQRLQQVRAHSGFIINTGDSIPRDAPSENVMAIVEATKRLRKHPFTWIS